MSMRCQCEKNIVAVINEPIQFRRFIKCPKSSSSSRPLPPGRQVLGSRLGQIRSFQSANRIPRLLGDSTERQQRSEISIGKYLPFVWLEVPARFHEIIKAALYLRPTFDHQRLFLAAFGKVPHGKKVAEWMRLFV